MNDNLSNNVIGSSDMINYDVVKIENAYKCLEDMRELESDSNYGKLKNGYHMDYPSDRYKIDNYKDKIDSPSCTIDAIKLLAYNIVALAKNGDAVFSDDIILKADDINSETELEEFGNYDDGDGAVKEVNEGSHTGTLNAPKGFITDGPGGPNGEPVYETWYDYKMSNVVDAMKNRGYDYDYSVDEETGIKMFGPYVMVAADVKNVANPDGTYNYGDIVETSVGTGMVVDYCGEAATKRENSNGIHFDIATAWHTKPYQARAYSKEEVEKAKGNATGM